MRLLLLSFAVAGLRDVQALDTFGQDLLARSGHRPELSLKPNCPRILWLPATNSSLPTTISLDF